MCGNSWCDLCDDSYVLSECDSVARSGVPVVTGVLVSPSSSVVVIGEALVWTLIGKTWNRSPFLSPDSVRSLVWRIKKI